MASQPNDQPESLIIAGFSGVKNTVSPERLGTGELETAVNVDIDDVGQLRRRRGYVLKSSGSWHSLRTVGGTVYGVKDGRLGIVRPDYSFVDIAEGGDARISYTQVGDSVYYSSEDVSGVIVAEINAPWGQIGGEGEWYSPVIEPTDTLGAVSGKLLGKPPLATLITYHSGRIWLARGKTLWATELYLYGLVDKTRTFFQFEHEITMLESMDDGIYVGTTGTVQFLRGKALANMELLETVFEGVVPGSAVQVPADLVHPGARQGDFPSAHAVVFMTSDGIHAGFSGGQCINLTMSRVEFPTAVGATAMFRQDSGSNHYVAAVDSGGSPAANARVGDFVDAEIRRFAGG